MHISDGLSVFQLPAVFFGQLVCQASRLCGVSGELGFNVDIKSGPIHCATDHPMHNQYCADRLCGECLCQSANKRRHTEQTIVNGIPATQTGHMRFDRGLINPKPAAWSLAHERLTAHISINSRQSNQPAHASPWSFDDMVALLEKQGHPLKTYQIAYVKLPKMTYSNAVGFEKPVHLPY